jgi:uncharacterized membrane protein YwzB
MKLIIRDISIMIACAVALTAIHSVPIAAVYWALKSSVER